MGPDEAEENRKAWFFASCDIRNLDPVAVAAARQLRAQTTGMPQFYEAWRIDRQAAEQLVMDLSLAVRAGKIRFERVPERAPPPPPPPRLPSPGESEQVAAARQRGPQEALQPRPPAAEGGGSQAPAAGAAEKSAALLDAENGLSKVKGGGFSGAGYIEEAHPNAIKAYEAIRASTTDVAAISKNTGISEQVIGRVKEHLFMTEHEVPIGPGEIRKGLFTPDKSIAELWDRAEKGTLSVEYRGGRR